MDVTVPEGLLFSQDGVVGVLTLNRPDAHNALLPEMIAGLDDVTRAFEQDDSLHVLVVTGAGDRAFCSGGDLKRAIPAATAAGASKPPSSSRTRRFFSEITKPIIAAVNGLAIAGGMEIVLGTDLRVAASTASFGLAEARWALIPAGGGTVRLPRQIAYVHAMEMMLLGDRIGADRAAEVGLINRVVPPHELMTEAMSLAQRVARNGPLALRSIKETVRRSHGLSWEQGFLMESYARDAVFSSADAMEGPRAFAEKREPRYFGR